MLVQMESMDMMMTVDVKLHPLSFGQNYPPVLPALKDHLTGFTLDWQWLIVVLWYSGQEKKILFKIKAQSSVEKSTHPALTDCDPRDKTDIFSHLHALSLFLPCAESRLKNFRVKKYSTKIQFVVNKFSYFKKMELVPCSQTEVTVN